MSSHSSGTNNGPMSNNLLRLKAEQIKTAHGIPTGSSNMGYSNKVKKYDSSSKMNSIRNKKLISHKNSNESGAVGTEQLDESFVPPQIIDNSAVLFSNTKRKKGKPKRNNVQNHLQSEVDKSDDEVDYKSVIDVREKKENLEGSNSEGECDGEGESYSSSCSCSS
jgi:hypothetical protein